MKSSNSIGLFSKGVSRSLLLFVCAVTAAAQTAPKTVEELKRRKDRLQAISMIEQTAAEAPLWNEKTFAVRALADAADLLWDEKPGQGVKWLIRAWELIEQVSDAPRDERLKEFFTSSDKTELRTTVLRVAHAHDRQLADKFLKQLGQEEPAEKKTRGAFDSRTDRSGQLLQMAQQTVSSNPELALSLAERSLADGISYGLQNVMIDLRKKDVELSNRLFDSALARFQGGEPDPSEGQVLSGYLFQPAYIFAVSPSGKTLMAMNPLQQNYPAVALSEPQRARAFLGVAFQKFFSTPIPVESPESRTRGFQIVSLGDRLAGPFRSYAPDLAPSALGMLAQLRRQLSPESATDNQSTASQAKGYDSTKQLTREELYEKRISELEANAEKESNPAFRKVAYVQAALAADPQDYARSKRIAEKIDDDDLRADAISFILYRAALAFVQTSENEKANDIAPKIGNVLRRSVVRLAIAQHLSVQTNSEDRTLREQRIFELLNDVGNELAKQEPSNAVARLSMGRTAVLATLDKDLALVALEQTLQIVNRVQGFDLNEAAAPELGLSVSVRSGANFERPRIGFAFRNAVEPLITMSFEQIAVTIDGLVSKEIRGVARLEVAKLYLRKSGQEPQKRPVTVPR